MPRFSPIVEIAPGATVTGNPNTYSWTDLTMQGFVHEPSGVSIRRGKLDRYSEASADTCALTLLNNGGRFVPRNPLSPWYGQITRGTPLRILMRPGTNSASDAFGRTASSSWGNADSGGAWTNVGTASDYSVGSGAGRHTNTAATSSHFSTLAFSLIRVDVKVRVRVNALSTGGGQQAGVALRYTDSANQKRAELLFAVGGVITLRIVSRSAGVDSTLASATLTATHSTSAWYWIRIQTGYNSSRAKAWVDGTTEPATWNLDGNIAPLTPTAGAVGCFSRRDTGNTNANATTDFDDFSLLDGPRIQFTGFVDQWPVRWNDPGMAQAFAPITASGQLQRLARTQPLKSLLYMLLSSATTAVGYWSMEDGSTSTSFASGLPSGRPGTFSGMSLAADPAVLGSEPLPTFSSTGSIAFQIPSYTFSGTWAVAWVMKIPASSISGPAQVLSWITPSSTVARWQLTLTPGAPDTLRLDGFLAAGGTVSGTAVNAVDSSSGAELTNGRQLSIQVNAVQNGGNVDVNWTVYFAADDGSGASSIGRADSFAGTTGRVGYIYHDAVTGFGGGGHTIGHLGLAGDVGYGPAGRGALGGAGDSTETRFEDLLNTQGITPFFGDLVRSTGTTSQLMGPQQTGDILSQLRIVEATELGVMYDGKQGFVHLLPRTMRYNRPVDLTLNFAAGQVGPPFEPSDDDYLLRNDQTVTNVGGSTARSTDPASIALQGVYADSVQVSTYYSADLQGHADWRKNLGTTSGLRYPSITLDLTRNSAALVNAWCDTDIGSRIQVTNVPAGELPPENLDLILDGYTEVITSSIWKATLNCSPGSQWLVAVLDAAAPRLDCGASTTSGTLTTSATSVPLTIADRCTWTHASGDFPVVIGGEWMTVTAVSAPVGAGSSWTQTLTVARSVNGIVKAHAAGEAVHVAYPIILAL